MSAPVDTLDRAWTRRRWRLACGDCGYTWRGRSAEATPCPECDSWAVVSAEVEALDESAE